MDYVAYGPGGTTLAAADYNGSTYLWDIATKKITATLPDPGSKGVDSVAYGPGGTTLAAADANGSTYLWDIATKKITATLPDPGSKGVDYVAYGPGGTTLAAADYNGSTYLWDIATKKITATLPDPGSEGVDSVAYGPGGTTLAAADSNGSTYLWDIATKTITATLPDPGSKGVDYVAYAPGGTTLAAADSQRQHLPVGYRHQENHRHPPRPGKRRAWTTWRSRRAGRPWPQPTATAAPTCGKLQAIHPDNQQDAEPDADCLGGRPVAYLSAAGTPLGKLTVFPWMRSIHSAAASVSGWSGPSLRRRWGSISRNSPSAPA